MTGYGIDEAIGRNPRMLKGDTPAEVHGKLWETISCGNVWEGDLHNKKKDGTPFLEHAVIAPIKNDAGAITHFLAIKEDITERRSLEDQLRQAQKMEAVGQLAGGVAHDFNNILQIIVGNAQLQEMFNQEHGLDCDSLEEIFKAVERGSSLTRSLLVFSRKQSLEISCFDLNDVIEESHKLAARLVTEEIQLSLDLYGGKLQVMGDAGLVQRVLFNLITNARDAIARTGQIRVTTELVEIDANFLRVNKMAAPEGYYAMLAVSDTGSGISEEIRSKIFDPFFTTKGVGKGTGLGLAMIHSTISQMRGHILVDSSPGQGAVIAIYLPLSGETPQAAALEISRRQHSLHGMKELILIVEDELGVRNSLAKSLEQFDYRVLKAGCASEAIMLVREHADDIKLAILDIVLPDINGIETLQALRCLCPGLQALFLSGYSDEILDAKGISEYHLRKPVHPVQLLKQVRRLLADSATAK